MLIAEYSKEYFSTKILTDETVTALALLKAEKEIKNKLRVNLFIRNTLDLPFSLEMEQKISGNFFRVQVTVRVALFKMILFYTITSFIVGAILGFLVNSYWIVFLVLTNTFSLYFLGRMRVLKAAKEMVRDWMVKIPQYNAD